MKRLYLGLLVAMSLSTLKANPPKNKLPEPILCAYTGWFAVNDTEHDFKAWEASYIEPLYQAGFNCFSPKIQAHHPNKKRERFNLKSPLQYARIKQLTDACSVRNMTLITYVYTDCTQRNPQRDAALHPAVNQEGEVLPNFYSLIQWKAWRQLLDRAYQLAEVSKTLPVAAIGVDLEMLLGTPVSYDDGAWQRFCKTADLPPLTARNKRYPLLQKAGKVDVYLAWWKTQMLEMAKRYEHEMHLINPHLSLGVMPACKSHWIVDPFISTLGTEQAPAIIDSWVMYNGSGITDGILKQQEDFKKRNPHNLFIGWFRPDNYSPEDLRVQAYYAAMKLDGYNNWHIGMFTDENCKLRVPPEFTLKQYRDAYLAANRAALHDKGATPRTFSIPWKQVTPRVATLDMQEILAMPVPDLHPVGDGSGKPRRIVTRALRRFYFWADTGEEVELAITHLAADRRPTALDYAVLYPDRKVIRHEQVSPGTTDTFKITAQRSGVHSLHVQASIGGGPWYGVRIGARHIAIPALDKKDPARLFFGCGGGKQAVLWAKRQKPQGEASLSLGTARHMMVEILANQAPRILAKDGQTVSVPLPETDAAIRLDIRQPADLTKPFYTQQALIWANAGVHPYLSDGPERLLLPKN